MFAERYKLRNNWLKGKCNVRTFEGHTQGNQLFCWAKYIVLIFFHDNFFKSHVIHPFH